MGRKDSMKVRKEKHRNRFKAIWIGKDHKPGQPLPPASFVLRKDEIFLANQRCSAIRVPSWIDWKQKAVCKNSVLEVSRVETCLNIRNIEVSCKGLFEEEAKNHTLCFVMR